MKIKEKYTFRLRKVAVRATEAGRQRPPGTFSPPFLPYLHFFPANNAERPKNNRITQTVTKKIEPTRSNTIKISVLCIT
jgi:hypothetical protein